MDRECFRYDILSELFNIGMGKAADMLSEIVQKRIALQIPKIIIPETESGELLGDQFSGFFDAALMVSTISFTNSLTGKANLVFPADKIKKFVALCSGEGSLAPEDTVFTDVDFDVIREIGNILLNCILGELGNLINIQLNYDLPQVAVYNRIDFNKDLDGEKNHSFMILFVTFLIDDTEIEGAVIIDLMVESFQELFRLLDGIEAGL
ncbi:chemotaxis protein CheC [Caproicibacter sp.]|uniref:chemotaxis protein CheC n=1 Tax=Caproicibacter sp. TaxID=2814884 RepID=UPI0039890BDF